MKKLVLILVSLAAIASAQKAATEAVDIGKASASVEVVKADLRVAEEFIRVPAHAVRPYERYTIEDLKAGDTLFVLATVNGNGFYKFQYVVNEPIEKDNILRACIKVECVEGK